MGWPKEVTVVGADDVISGKMHGEDGTHCALGWAHIHLAQPGRIALATGGMLAEFERSYLFAAHVARLPQRSMIAINDDAVDAGRCDLAAKLINRAWALLGYTEGNPEAAWAARHPMPWGGA